MWKRIAILMLFLVSCQATPELELRDFEPSEEFVWQPQGHSYMFVCEEELTRMLCVAKSAAEHRNVLIQRA